MTYSAKILADSIASGVRLTTLEVTFPRIVLAEFNTHRMLSRNSASSRAIPVEKNIERVMREPFVPEAFARNIRGMQGGSDFDYSTNEIAREAWLVARSEAVDSALKLAKLGVHKQWANRLLEPFSWHTCIVTATEWENFFALRCNAMAAPEIRTVAELMREAMKASTPLLCEPSADHVRGWHLPMVHAGADNLDAAFDAKVEALGLTPIQAMVRMSVARSARVSYLTHDGKRDGKRDVEADLALYDRLLTSGHMSPFEHAAFVTGNTLRDTRVWAGNDGDFCGNFRLPWVQHRKQIDGEAVFGGAK